MLTYKLLAALLDYPGSEIVDDLRSAVADLSFVFATTARERDGFKRVAGPVEAARLLRAHGGHLEGAHLHHQQPHAQAEPQRIVVVPAEHAPIGRQGCQGFGGRR